MDSAKNNCSNGNVSHDLEITELDTRRERLRKNCQRKLTGSERIPGRAKTKIESFL